MVRVCDIIDLISANYLKQQLYIISSNNETSNILYLKSKGGTTNVTLNWKDIINEYQIQLNAVILDASPGSEMPQCRLEKTLWILIPIVLLVLGSIGNCISFAILTKKAMHSYVYLSALAMADQGVLITGLMRHWVDRILGYQIEDSHHWVCVFTQLVGCSLSYLSAWIIVAVTAERAIVIMFPFSSIRLYSRSREILVVLIIALTCVFAASHFLFSVRIELGQERRFTIDDVKVQNYSQCRLRKELQKFSKAWQWIDALLYSYLPFFLILCLNGLIVTHVRKAKSNRTILTSTCPASDGPIKKSSVRNLQSKVNPNLGSRQTFQLTLMLVSISVCFLITTCPIVVMKIISYTQNRDSWRISTLALYQLLDSVAELLMYLNHSANFYLYCATGSRFRNEFRTLCSKNRNVQNRFQNQTTVARSKMQ